MYLKYCIKSGSSRPISIRIAIISASEDCSPKIDCAGHPGAKDESTKITNITPKITGIKYKNLFITNLCTISPLFGVYKSCVIARKASV
jgi:hypothetical protein